MGGLCRYLISASSFPFDSKIRKGKNMALFKIFRGPASALPPSLHDGYAYFTTDDQKFYIDTADKRSCINDAIVHIKTTAEWQAADISVEQGHIYVYSDYQQDKDGNNIPGIKIGDGGHAALNHTPFIDAHIMGHINNKDIHITNAERTKWNNKVTTNTTQIANGILIFSKD